MISRFVKMTLENGRRPTATPVAVSLMVLAATALLPHPAEAVPSFAVQTGQPCAACHVGSFGPQLTSFGRDFKLFGYVASKGKATLPPVSAMVTTSFTHTGADQNPPPAPWTGPNDNISLDQVSLFYAGAIIPDLMGAFVQATYDGVHHVIHWDNTDIRLAKDTDISGTDLVYGITINNNPTVQDLWNSTPGWRFPYVQSALAGGPAAATRIDGNFAQKVVGVGLYAMWNDLLYAEADAYIPLNIPTLYGLGLTGLSGSDTVDGVMPYWRVSLQHAFDQGHHSVQVGTYGMTANVFPGNDHSTGQTDGYTDVAADVNYQWYAKPSDVTADIFSAHATYIHEDQDLAASSLLAGTNAHDQLNTLRLDASYSLGATYTPSVQYFRTWGSNDAALWTASTNGSPNSAGYVGEIAWSPMGKPGNSVQWFNPHVTLQYVAYTQFNGTSMHAGDNNTVFLNLWFALGLPN